MPKITQEAALEKIRKLIDESKSIQSGSSEHIGWYRTVQIAVDRIFGNQSSQSTDIKERIGYTLGTQRAILNSMAREIEDYWEDHGAPDLSEDTEEGRVNNKAAVSQIGLPQNRNIVFVVHGRNVRLRDALFRFLRSIGLNPLEWSQAINATGTASPYIGEILDTAFSKAGAIVVLMTPDDEAYLKDEFRTTNDPPYESHPTPQARPNVLFEAGMAMGRSAERTILIEVGTLRPFSDVGGRHVLRLSNSTERRQELAQRLENAGCSVDLTGTDWHREGDFEL
jgi:predicted nucleotide-binding protein